MLLGRPFRGRIHLRPERSPTRSLDCNMQTANDLLRTAKLMSSFRGRMHLAEEAAAAEEADKKNSHRDPWF